MLPTELRLLKRAERLGLEVEVVRPAKKANLYRFRTKVLEGMGAKTERTGVADAWALLDEIENAMNRAKRHAEAQAGKP